MKPTISCRYCGECFNNFIDCAIHEGICPENKAKWSNDIGQNSCDKIKTKNILSLYKKPKNERFK